jgi:hypothetical protein
MDEQAPTPAGTVHWPQELSPHATGWPVKVSATEWKSPAAILRNGPLPAGVFSWP